MALLELDIWCPTDLYFKTFAQCSNTGKAEHLINSMAFFYHRTKETLSKSCFSLPMDKLLSCQIFLRDLVILKDLRGEKSSRKRSQFYPYLPRQGCGWVGKLCCPDYMVQDNIQQTDIVLSLSNIPAGLLTNYRGRR